MKSSELQEKAQCIIDSFCETATSSDWEFAQWLAWQFEGLDLTKLEKAVFGEDI